MTDFMKEAVMNKDFNYDKYKTVFDRTFDILKPLGAGVFNSKNGNFSTAVYDTTVIGISENIHLYGGINPQVLRNKMKEVRSDDIYQAMTRSGGNNSVERVKKRLEFAKTIFGKV
jgi:hypothetical protein